MIKTYRYSDNVQLAENFMSSEFRCKCGKQHDYYVDDTLVSNLQKLFTVIPQLFGIKVSKIIITSGYRCPAHDKEVHGSGSGPHTKGYAADYCVYDDAGKIISTKLVCCAAEEIGFNGIANIDANYLFIHSDTMGRRWLGNECVNGNSSINAPDFWTYFGITKPTNKTPAEAVVGKGIDVSVYQGNIDFAAAAKEIDFAVLRAGFGKSITQKDEKFEQNYAGFKAAGVPVGVYWYCYATSTEEARQEAQACLQALKGKQFELPIFYDILEDDHIPKLKAKGDVATLINQIVPTFCSILEQNGYYVGVYCNTAGYQQYLNDSNKQRYVQWCADWRGYCGYTGEKVLWQYSCKGKISGISGDVDKDYAYTDFAIIKEGGFNGWDAADYKQDPDNPDDEPQNPSIIPEKQDPTPEESLSIFEKILKEVQAIKDKL